MSNDTLFDTIVDIASRIEGSHFSLGGNAPVMAKRFAVEGCEVLLAAKMTPKLQESLPQGITGKLKVSASCLSPFYTRKCKYMTQHDALMKPYKHMRFHKRNSGTHYMYKHNFFFFLGI
jgi:hypothetical protein